MTSMERDVAHVRLLSILHYLLAGCVALFALFPVAHLAVGVAMVTGRLGDASAPFDLREFGWMFILVASTIITAGLAFAGCILFAGRCLARRAHHVFCVVTAALECLVMPFGTVLGVFTIVVLQRPSVKQLFRQPEAATPSD